MRHWIDSWRIGAEGERLTAEQLHNLGQHWRSPRTHRRGSSRSTHRWSTAAHSPCRRPSRSLLECRNCCIDSLTSALPPPRPPGARQSPSRCRMPHLPLCHCRQSKSWSLLHPGRDVHAGRMGARYCPACGCAAETETYCTQCGAGLLATEPHDAAATPTVVAREDPRTKPSLRRPWIVAIGILAVLLAGGAGYAFMASTLTSASTPDVPETPAASTRPSAVATTPASPVKSAIAAPVTSAGRYLSDADMADLVPACGQGSRPTAIRDTAFVLTLASTGARLTEIAVAELPNLHRGQSRLWLATKKGGPPVRRLDPSHRATRPRRLARCARASPGGPVRAAVTHTGRP